MHLSSLKERINLRSTIFDDQLLYFEWANDPAVRNFAIRIGSIPIKGHIEWFIKKMESKNTFMYVLEYQNQPVGQIRFDLVNGNYEIDYSIAKYLRGQGLGRKIVEMGINSFNKISPNSKYRALVSSENFASIKIFKDLGFVQQEMLVMSNREFLVFKFNSK